MRVCLISSHSFLKPGGVKRHIFGLKEEFKRRGIYTKIIAPRRKSSENYGEDVILLGTSFPVIIGGTQADFVVHFNPLAINRVLRKEKFDILHFHNFILPSAWQILEKSKGVNPVRNFKNKVSDNTFESKISNGVNILTIHADPGGSKFLKNFPGLLPLWRKIICGKIHGLIGVAPLTLKGFENFKGPKTIIPNGINLEEFNPQVKKPIRFCDSEGEPSVPYGADGKLNLLFVGRLEERKGLIYLLKAYQILEKQFKNLRLIVVGEGPLKQKSENFVRENNLKEVYFEGEKTDHELVSYYNTADIFISPAIFGESFGIVFLEAMACRKPVLGFDNDGYKEFLKDKKGGILVKNRDVQDLTEKIAALIKNPKLRKKMGERGLREAKNYSWQNIADKVLDFYHLCLKIK